MQFCCQHCIGTVQLMLFVCSGHVALPVGPPNKAQQRCFLFSIILFWLPCIQINYRYKVYCMLIEATFIIILQSLSMPWGNQASCNQKQCKWLTSEMFSVVQCHEHNIMHCSVWRTRFLSLVLGEHWAKHSISRQWQCTKPASDLVWLTWYYGSNVLCSLVTGVYLMSQWWQS